MSGVRGVALYIDLLPLIEEKDRSFGFGFVIEVRVGEWTTNSSVSPTRSTCPMLPDCRPARQRSVIQNSGAVRSDAQYYCEGV